MVVLDRLENFSSGFEDASRPILTFGVHGPSLEGGKVLELLFYLNPRIFGGPLGLGDPPLLLEGLFLAGFLLKGHRASSLRGLHLLFFFDDLTLFNPLLVLLRQQVVQRSVPIVLVI